MNRSLLQLIVKISETGSFTRAGEELNMTQPAVSRAVSALESELGVTLLTRNRRHGVVLTDIGERVVRIFREILNGYAKVDEEIAREKGLEAGIVRIGAFPMASTYFLPPILSHIANRYPDIEFTISEGSVEYVKEWLDSRRIDVGLIIPPTGDFDAFPLYRDEMFAVLRDDHPLSAKSSLRAADLEDQAMLVCRGGYEPPIVNWFESGGGKLKVRDGVYNYMTGLNLVQRGMGIAIMSELALSHSPEHVVARKLDPSAYRDIHIAVTSYKGSSIAVKHFIQTALELFPQTPEADAP